jgi:hypothetical protein
VPFADLPEHPAYGFVNQVFPIPQQPLGNPERVGEVILTDEVVSRNNANPPLPEAFRRRQAIEWLAA